MPSLRSWPSAASGPDRAAEEPITTLRPDTPSCARAKPIKAGAAVAASSNRGVLVSSLSSAQQAYVTAAIQQYLNDYDSATAARMLAAYQAAYGSTYVAWANASGSFSSTGPDISANGTYMRIDGPRVWIELAAQNGVVITNQTHYHMIFRDKSYDYYNQLGS
nr:DUF3500 domain-containing protein [Aquabacterium sp.]